MSLEDKIHITGQTDSGIVRDHNEDSIGSLPELGLAVLADGMGGHKGGEVASALAVDSILSSLDVALREIKAGEIDDATGYSLESIAIETAIKQANTVIYQASQENKQYEGMGTTIVVLLFYDNRISVAHVGDSRLYRIRNDKLELMTRDHTLLQELVDRGFYTPEEAQKSLNKNLVTRAVGVSPTVDIDLLEDMATPGDIYLLCSDGLNDMISDEMIESSVVNFKDNLDTVASELISQAKKYGGKDNVSALLAQTLKPYPANSSWFTKFFDFFS